MDTLCTKLADLRARFIGTSRRGVLLDEVGSMIRLAEHMSLANGERHFISRMDHAYSMNRSVWGDRETLKLMEQGHLSAFVPTLVARLSASTQDKAYAFFEDLIRELREPDARSRVPEDLRERIECAMKDYSRSNPAYLSFDDLGRLRGCDYSALSSWARESSRSVRLFACPQDLYFVADTGLLMSVWQTFIRSILTAAPASWVAADE